MFKLQKSKRHVLTWYDRLNILYSSFLYMRTHILRRLDQKNHIIYR